MSNLAEWIPASDFALIKPHEMEWLTNVFNDYSGSPTLEQLWNLMDNAWRDCECDQANPDERLSAFYSHPVWLLNGYFSEQDAQSIYHRKHFADWVVAHAPKRVADFGGGFGSLARMIGEACPETSIDVIEMYPHPVAVERAQRTQNVRYRPSLGSNYDILIATDVFEHVPDPLGLVTETAPALNSGGLFLIANCFFPVILCHLPSTFHFRHSWDAAMQAFGFIKSDTVLYGQAFVKSQGFNLDAARLVEKKSRLLWNLLQHLPEPAASRLARLIF